MIFFAQIREDGEVERRAFEGARRVLAVASGGCVALSLLAEDRERIDAVDANESQVSLLRAKVRAIEALDRDAFLVAAGERDGDREALGRTLEIDGGWTDGWTEEVLTHGLLHAGLNERFYRFVGRNLMRNVASPEAWETLLQSRDVDAQRRWLAEHASGPAWRAAIGVLLSRTTHEHFFPPAPFAHIAEPSFARFFEERFAHELTTRPAFDNPFLHQLLRGRYAPHALPAYLREGAYDRVRAALPRLNPMHTSLAELPTPGRLYDAVTLSNVFDWASDAEAEAIVRRVREVASGARVVVRQMLDARPLPLPVVDAIDVEDRAMLYRRVVVGRIV